MTNRRHLPIAILTDNISIALNWARRNIFIRTINSSNRLIIATNGQEYVLITYPEQLRGIEIKTYFTVFTEDKDYRELMLAAKERTR